MDGNHQLYNVGVPLNSMVEVEIDFKHCLEQNFVSVLMYEIYVLSEKRFKGHSIIYFNALP